MAADLKFVELCARQIARVAMIKIVEKSTLPVRTAKPTNDLYSTGNGVKFEVLSNLSFGRGKQSKICCMLIVF
jgi:UDPglucose 6-dehydrogenase